MKLRDVIFVKNEDVIEIVFNEADEFVYEMDIEEDKLYCVISTKGKLKISKVVGRGRVDDSLELSSAIKFFTLNTDALQ